VSKYKNILHWALVMTGLVIAYVIIYRVFPQNP